MNKKMPWDEIREPGTDYNVRLVEGSGNVPLYWGKDPAGHCLFIVELKGDHSEKFRKEGSSVHGINVDLRSLGLTSSQRIVLTLEQHVDSDLFMGLCETLIGSLKTVPDSSTALEVTLAHIKRWKAFLAGRKGHLLSAEEIKGLFSELVFLRSLYQDHLDQKSAIDAWVGPERSHQDFIFGNTAVEVKSLSGRERSTVRISSEDQLESLCDNLFLMIYRLSDMPGSDSSLSLNKLVHLIEYELADSSAIEELQKRLTSYGYVEMREYDKPEFVVTSQHAYCVIEGFPRLIRSDLPSGILRLGYEIELEKIKRYECELDNIWRC